MGPSTTVEPRTIEPRIIEQRIVERARSFDLGALVAVLRHHGFAGDDVMFQSNAEAGSPKSLVEAVEFAGEASDRYAIVTLNLGLLGSQSLLPSYFFQVVSGAGAGTSRTDPEDAFADFIRFFDDRLLGELAVSIAPERHEGVLHDWGAAREHARHLVGLGSPLGLYGIVRAVFPEFAVRVDRARLQNLTSAYSAAVGGPSLDGSAVLGRVYESRATGFCVDLVIEDELDDYGRAWVAVARERLRRVLLPLLARHELALRIALTVVHHGRWAHVDDPSAGFHAHGDLGSERLRGRIGPHTVSLYSGLTREGDPGELIDRFRTRFPQFEVEAEPLGSFAPLIAGDRWPAGFAVRLRPGPDVGNALDDLTRCAGDQVFRELIPALADYQIGLVVGLERQCHSTTILYRGIPGER